MKYLRYTHKVGYESSYLNGVRITIPYWHDFSQELNENGYIKVIKDETKYTTEVLQAIASSFNIIKFIYLDEWYHRYVKTNQNFILNMDVQYETDPELAYFSGLFSSS